MAKDEDYPMPSHYEPPSLRLLMEVLRLLAADGKVTLTLTISTKD